MPDLESSLCVRQRNHLREVFVAASEVRLSKYVQIVQDVKVSRVGDGWIVLQAYNMLVEITRSYQNLTPSHNIPHCIGGRAEGRRDL